MRKVWQKEWHNNNSGLKVNQKKCKNELLGTYIRKIDLDMKGRTMKQIRINKMMTVDSGEFYIPV